jgi:hypothetical protein
VPLHLAASPHHVNSKSAALRSRSEGVASGALRAVRFWHLASLDAPTVALVWSLAFAWCVSVHLQPWVLAVQALGVWTIYVADRLLDARSALRNDAVDHLRERHFFHWRHRRIFLPLATAAAILSAELIFSFMPLAARERNSLVAAAALLYFARVHSPRPKSGLSVHLGFSLFSKEFFVGLLFTMGCVLPTVGRLAASGKPVWQLLIAAVVFAQLAWLNCQAIESWESHLPVSPRFIRVAAYLLAAASLLLAVIMYAAHPRTAALLAAGGATALLLALLDRVRPRLASVTLRAAADLALLTPLALLLMPLAQLAR